MSIKDSLLKFWKFLREDSWPSFFVSLILIIFFIKIIFFPTLSFITGSSLPLVIVESCSMYHSQSLEGIMEDKIYSDYNLSFENTSEWALKSGFTKGDIIIIYRPEKLKVGDIIVFEAGQSNPIIHRIISIDNEVYTTKGDHNHGFLPYEKEIYSYQIMGKAVFKIPFIGWVKLFFFDLFKDPSQRGLCV